MVMGIVAQYIHTHTHTHTHTQTQKKTNNNREVLDLAYEPAANWTWPLLELSQDLDAHNVHTFSDVLSL